MYAYHFLGLRSTVNYIHSQELDIIVPEKEIDIATKTTETRIFVKYKIMTLTEEDLKQFNEPILLVQKLCTQPAGTIHDSLNNVLKDLEQLSKTLTRLNTATLEILQENTEIATQNYCTSEVQTLSKAVFTDMIQDLTLSLKTAPMRSTFAPAECNDPEDAKFKLVANLIFTMKGIITEFIDDMNKQYTYLLELENFKLPSVITHKLKTNQCVQHNTAERFIMEKVKNYKEGVIVTIKLIQHTHMGTYFSWRSVPFVGYRVDVGTLFTKITDKDTFYEQHCTIGPNSENCEVKTVMTPCLEAIRKKQIALVLNRCTIMAEPNINPFLTVQGTAKVQYDQITLLEPASHELSSTFEVPPNPNGLPFIVQSEKTIEIQVNNETFHFGPTADKTTVYFSYLSETDLMEIQFFLSPWLNPQKQLIYTIISALGVTISLIVALSWKLGSRKREQNVKLKYLASFQKGRNPIIIKVDKQKG